MLKRKGNKNKKHKKDGEKTFSRMQRRMNQEALCELQQASTVVISLICFSCGELKTRSTPITNLLEVGWIIK